MQLSLAYLQRVAGHSLEHFAGLLKEGLEDFLWRRGRVEEEDCLDKAGEVPRLALATCTKSRLDDL
jgi:hypothetical protein